jgi:NTP pyrophosphatase (non-canonical NTP hydrolase)
VTISMLEYESGAWTTFASKYCDKPTQFHTTIYGLYGELNEYLLETLFTTLPDKEKCLNELGDILYYTTIACNLHGISIDDIIPNLFIYDTKVKAAQKMLIDSITLYGERMKKFFFHRHLFLSELEVWEFFHSILLALKYNAHLSNTTLEMIAERNHNKLKARYPDGFSTHASVNRDK